MASKRPILLSACLLMVAVCCAAREGPKCGVAIETGATSAGLQNRCCRVRYCNGNWGMCTNITGYPTCHACGGEGEPCCVGKKTSKSDSTLRPCKGNFKCTSGICKERTPGPIGPDDKTFKCTPTNLVLNSGGFVANPYPFNVSACAWRDNTTNPDRVHLIYILTGNLSSINFQVEVESHNRTEVNASAITGTNNTYFESRFTANLTSGPFYNTYITSSLQWDVLSSTTISGPFARDTTGINMTVDDKEPKSSSRLGVMGKPDNPGSNGNGNDKEGKEDKPGNPNPGDKKPDDNPGANKTDDKPGDNKPDGNPGDKRPDDDKPWQGGSRVYYGVVSLYNNSLSSQWEGVAIKLGLSARIAVRDAGAGAITKTNWAQIGCGPPILTPACYYVTPLAG